MKALLFSNSTLSLPASVSMLVLRLVFGGFMVVGHGWGKLVSFQDIVDSGRFMDFMGLGVSVSLGLAVFAEVFCAAFVTLGLFTRVSLIPLIITMAVAAFLAHGGDPFFMPNPIESSKEPALMYLGAYIALFAAGPGKFSLDALIRK